jgi:hypothetical protein
VVEENDTVRWITVSMKGTDGRVKPIGVWISNEEGDIFGDLDPGDGSDWMDA